MNGIVDTRYLLAGLGIEKRISTDALPGEGILGTLGTTMRGHAGADLLTGTLSNDTGYVDDAGDRITEPLAAARPTRWSRR